MSEKIIKRSRGWSFTLNNYSDEDVIKFKNLEVQYMCFGKEIGKEGTPHLQGYLYYQNAVEFETLKRFCNRTHWEASRYSAAVNRKYCSKEQGEFWEKGVPPRQGRRSDLTEVAELVHNGTSLQEVVQEFPEIFVRYSKGLTILSSKVMKDRTEMPEVTWLWGGTGVGKTRTATEMCKSFYMKDGTIWWDGYEQQECIVVDDFDGKWEWRNLLRFLDRYPYQGQTKGGYVKINSPKIVFTCEFPPEHFWSGSQLAQIRRRIFKVTQMCNTEVDSNTNVSTSSTIIDDL